MATSDDERGVREPTEREPRLSERAAALARQVEEFAEHLRRLREERARAAERRR